MKRLWCRTTLLAMILLVVLAYPASAHAQCSDETLQGGYGYSIQGTNFARDTPWAMVGRFVADAKGGMSATGTQSTKGEITYAKFTGTYKVAEDCSGVATFSFGGNARVVMQFVIVDSGNRLEMIVADQGVLEVGHATKIVTTRLPAASPTAPLPAVSATTPAPK